ncbi:S8 family serine peptidase [Zobellia sp. 1_MG-2023]|uniref:S8 family serine peptidase n=1 Tax=Zobellia sp. 1_MG-2023 TaxID=3062626 RepID=UPI0026E2D934|nr:S8 family serine peptidase [Zobellia sp. 1_MG-2023]MDO6821276.1 S8 family serine peptidase [Zobellia sp. 1_MG-2023]
MKMKITLLLLTGLVLTSCTKLEDFSGSIKDDYSKGENFATRNGYSDSQIIVRFKNNLSESDKIDIRKDFGVEKNFELCSCGDPNLELWGIDPNVETVEFAVERLRRRSAAEGDFLFDMKVEPIKGYETKGAAGQIEANLISTTAKDGINIAIIDSGIDYGQPFTANPFKKSYLFDTSTLLNCQSSITGWNFTDEGAPNDVFDYNGHGSLVTKIITTTLDNKQYDYNILPIKAFKENGEGSYWNVVCAFGYIQKVQEEGGAIDLVNASFGKSIDSILFDSNSLLNTIIHELGQTGALVITSAGNDGLDTDYGPKKHFPSGFATEYNLGVGGYKYNSNPNARMLMHPDSNFGTTSIDVAAPYDGWLVSFGNTSYSDIEGTSFSTAYVTGLLGTTSLEKGKPDPKDLKSNFLNNSYGTVHYSNNLISFIANGTYVKLQ